MEAVSSLLVVESEGQVRILGDFKGERIHTGGECVRRWRESNFTVVCWFGWQAAVSAPSPKPPRQYPASSNLLLRLRIRPQTALFWPEIIAKLANTITYPDTHDRWIQGGHSASSPRPPRLSCLRCLTGRGPITLVSLPPSLSFSLSPRPAAGPCRSAMSLQYRCVAKCLMIRNL